MSLDTLDLLSFSRAYMLELMNDLTLEQVNRIPQGFRNNLVWQLGHVIVAEQIYGYQKAGHPINIDQKMIEAYGNGTVPTGDIDQASFDLLKKLGTTTLEQLKKHREDGLFNKFEPFTLTPRQFPVNSIDDALSFLLFHEGQHLGVARALKVAVKA